MGGNPLAERRRLRKLENQRLEEAARRRQEELRLQAEAEQKRLEDERVAEEQRRFQEREELRRQKAAEVERIATLEREEKKTVADIERRLQLVGAFCTATIALEQRIQDKSCTPSALPLSVAVLISRTLDIPIVGVEDDVVFVADSDAYIHAFTRKHRRPLFVACFHCNEKGEDHTLQHPVSLVTTRCGRLVVCDQERGRVAVIELRALFQLYRATQLPVHSKGESEPCLIDGSGALTAFIGSPSTLSSPQGLAIDDAASEVYISDQASNCIRVFKLSTSAPTTKSGGFERSIAGAKGSALKRPGGLDVSHYHVVVCDVGNSRLVVFAKRGAFVQAFGRKGSQSGQFQDPRDVKLANVRKRAISRGLSPEDTGAISNEQFEVIVADCGNFRVQILNERGEFLRQLSLLADAEQVTFQRNQFARLRADLTREYAVIQRTPPVLSGEGMNDIYTLASTLHPSSEIYTQLTRWQADWRHRRARFHHPFSLAYAPSERELLVVDRENACSYAYNFDGAGCNWLQLRTGQRDGVCSVHSCLELDLVSGSGDNDPKKPPTKRWLYVSDPLAHRIAVFDSSDRSLQFFVGATTYGDQELCSNGFLPGELNFPSFLAYYVVDNASSDTTSVSTTILIVSDSGNHFVSLFDARNGEFCRRIGEGFGHQNGYFDSPQGVAVWENRELFVCDQRNHRVQIFDLISGRFMRTFGRLGVKAGDFHFPTGIALCPALPEVAKCDFGPHRGAKVVVADAGNCRVQILDLEGHTQLVLDTTATPFDQPMAPVGVWVQRRSGYVLVCDATNRCVAVFTNTGVFLSSFGATGEADTRFFRPMGVLIVPQSSGVDSLLVADAIRRDIGAFELRL